METGMLGVSVLWVINGEFIKGKYLEEHTHIFYQIAVCRSGIIECKVDGKAYTLSMDTALLSPPGQLHCFEQKIGESTLEDIKFCVFDPDLIHALGKLPTFIQLDIISLALWDIIIDSSKELGYYYSQDVDSAVTHFICHLIKAVAANANMESSEVLNKTSENLEKITDFIDENYRENITLDMVANAAGYSRTYTSAIFKKIHGMTISEYVNHVRTRKACELLTDIRSALSLNEVCTQCGFSTIYNFIRTFKRIVGVPPGKYRTAWEKEVVCYRDDTEITRLPKDMFIAAVKAGKVMKGSNSIRSIFPPGYWDKLKSLAEDEGYELKLDPLTDSEVKMQDYFKYNKQKK